MGARSARPGRELPLAVVRRRRVAWRAQRFLGRSGQHRTAAHRTQRAAAPAPIADLAGRDGYARARAVGVRRPARAGASPRRAAARSTARRSASPRSSARLALDRVVDVLAATAAALAEHLARRATRAEPARARAPTQRARGGDAASRGGARDGFAVSAVSARRSRGRRRAADAVAASGQCGCAAPRRRRRSAPAAALAREAPA